MIIECPACATRYDIKADFPPEGRIVRCARCGSVWRAAPDPIGQEAEDREDFWADPREENKTNGPAASARTSHDPFSAVGRVEDQPAASGHGVIASEEPRLTPEIDETFEDAPARQDAATRQDAGKVRWFLSFRRGKKESAQEAERNAARTMTQPPAETILFPRTASSNAPQDPDPAGRLMPDSTRQTVRGVFSDLQPAARSGEGESVPANSQAFGEADPVWSQRWADFSERFKKAEGGDPSLFEAHRKHDAAAQNERPSGANEKEGVAEDGDDPDASLRAALKAHFRPQANKTPAAAPLLPSENLARKLETHLKSKAAGAEAEEGEADRADVWREAADEDRRELEPAITVDPVEVKDEDFDFDERLYREIEETQEKSGSGARPARGGGLALAAAWGLFLCVAGGLIAGFFAFRDIIADAAPGLAALYRELGTPVTAQPLVFEEVQYKWSTSDNRPVLKVWGSVVNRSHSSAKVPQFFITVKDQDPQRDLEYSANLKVKGSKIGSNESADFDMELVSPNPTVTAVEFDLRSVR